MSEKETSEKGQLWKGHVGKLCFRKEDIHNMSNMNGQNLKKDNSEKDESEKDNSGKLKLKIMILVREI